MCIRDRKRNDTRTAVKATLIGDDGSPVDLAGASVRFLVTDFRGTSIIARQVDIVSAVEGKVLFVPEAPETGQAGTYRGEFEATFDDGRLELSLIHIFQQTHEDDLIAVSLLEEREVSQGSLPVGNISSNEIVVRLSNEDKRFDPDNDSSPLYGLIKPNRRVRAWLGTEIGGEAEWVPLGTFWSIDLSLIHI